MHASHTADFSVAPEVGPAGGNSSATVVPASEPETIHGSLSHVHSVPRVRSSRFSVLLDSSVDYTAYRAEYGHRFLQQQPKFDSLRDAEVELECILHDDAFALSNSSTSAVMAENVALAIDWFISALVLLFDGDEPFQNPDFLRFCCMFFASPLYENNTRLVQRHMVKRTYAELNTGPDDGYGDTLWLLLAFLHLITEFQQDTYLLCKDTGLFPLLQRLVLRAPEKHLHVLAMSLMFEIAQAVSLSQPDLLCATDDFLLFLFEYIERMRYAESDVYNNTGTKLVLALNEQFLRLNNGLKPATVVVTDQQLLAPCGGDTIQSRNNNPGIEPPSSPLSIRSTGRQISHDTYNSTHSQTLPRAAHHVRTSSACFPAASHADSKEATAEVAATDICGNLPPPLHPTLRTLSAEMHLLSRSRSMDFNSLIHSESKTQQHQDEALPDSQSHTQSTPVVAILARRADCCKTFTENLVFLLNRETDPATQTLILNMLTCILANASTSGILYTNDMHVLVDILIRDLSNLSEGQQRLRQAYLRVVCALLRNTVFLAIRHRLSDIELCLVNILRQSLICSQGSRSAVSRRGSVSSSSTRHNSMVSSDLSALVSGVNGRGSQEMRRESRAASPVSSLSSVVSDETCYMRQTDDHHHNTEPQIKISRRPAPPPPPKSLAASCLASGSQPVRHSQNSPTLLQPTPHGGSPLRPSSPQQLRRRRAPPPPPPSSSSSSRVSRLSRVTSARDLAQLNTVNEGIELDSPCGSDAGGSRSPRRKAPPPPPPRPRSRSASRGCYAATASSAQGHQQQQRSLQTPTPPPVIPRRREKVEQSGLRRQLSVKRSVSKYKRSSIRPPPPPPPVSPATVVVSQNHADNLSTDEPSADAISNTQQEDSHLTIHGRLSAYTRREDDDDIDDDMSEVMSARSDMEDSTEERRATRKLVENALRSCHEARHFAAARGMIAGSSG
ncbi:pre-rRNA processing [Coemansia spiralis]|uniref:Pre-rRNA processing n=2 Tax=Coemansia TaxID=4863 RepID=A0A9W8KZY1_9FUNG|nr:hypothetical protein BX070DRAFT_219241 [Coemansia spiralis]KAJ1994440.1 pre-rRNA processing [Coemansia umbellata]KAJ2624248.1 pre-rRNA processing [Coemansia sp. RSA 1358]KAJ2679373.1 pre-rRNA processing [Coemansia spiralis]